MIPNNPDFESDGAQLRSWYRQLPGAEPSAGIDDLLAKAARQPLPARRRKTVTPAVALAAMLVLTVGIVFQIVPNFHSPSPLEMPLAPAAQRLPSGRATETDSVGVDPSRPGEQAPASSFRHQQKQQATSSLAEQTAASPAMLAQDGNVEIDGQVNSEPAVLESSQEAAGRSPGKPKPGGAFDARRKPSALGLPAQLDVIHQLLREDDLPRARERLRELLADNPELRTRAVSNWLLEFGIRLAEL